MSSDRAPWQNRRVLSTLVLVFLAGASVGAFSMQFGLHGRMHRAAAAPGRDSAMQKLKVELNLTGAQTEQIARILEDYRGYYQSIQDQLDDVRATGKNQILKILNTEQRSKFEKMMGDLAPQLSAPSK